MFYRSERLFLRPAFPEDSRAIFEGICDAGVVQMLASAPWPYGLADAEDFVGRWNDGSETRFLVTLPAKRGRVIGCVGFGKRDGGAEPEFGYWIARSHWGNGYATEAGRAVSEIARSLGYSRLAAGHYVDNPASGRVLRKIGFRSTGEVRPTVCKARGGAIVLARRYVLELAGENTTQGGDAAQMRAA
jgi:RimJ/RimL family protein N-acetyltransferase